MIIDSCSIQPWSCCSSSAWHKAEGANRVTKNDAGLRGARDVTVTSASPTSNAGYPEAQRAGVGRLRPVAELPDLFDDGDMLLPPSKWPKHMRRLVDKVKIEQKRTSTVIIDSNGKPIVVPMYTKEVTLGKL